MATKRIVIIGAGMGGLAAALDLAVEGMDVTVVERGPGPGGKARPVAIGDHTVDSGPTVFTMRWVYDALFERAGTRLEDHITLRPAEILARHRWSEDEQLDLFADPERSAEAIAAFAGPEEAEGYRAFCREATGMYGTLREKFFQRNRAGQWGLLARIGVRRTIGLKPYEVYATELGRRLKDPRLRQLFGRYAALAGTSPYQATASLMAAAHIEQEGVWLVADGIHTLPSAMAALAAAKGASFRYDTAVSEIIMGAGRAAGVRLANGEAIHADAVVMNGEPWALGLGLLGSGAKAASPAPPKYPQRSLSAVTWAAVGHATGPGLVQHNVFFSSDYPLEFKLLGGGLLPTEPTTYLYAQDRTDQDSPPPEGPERLLLVVMAPASGDRRAFSQVEIEQCMQGIVSVLSRSGVQLHLTDRPVMSTPASYHRAYPGSAGMLYGMAALPGTGTLARPGSRSLVPGLYLAGGSCHPGPGMPLATLSGRLAATSIVQDVTDAHVSRRARRRGGILPAG